MRLWGWGLFCASVGATVVLSVSAASTKGIETNQVFMPLAPRWLTKSRVSKVTDRLERELEWDLRRVQADWYADAAAFRSAHGLGALPLAVSLPAQNKILLGPRVTDKNFDEIFGHELTHFILYQKYKGAVPKWLEEGMANYFGGRKDLNYQWLSGQLEKGALPDPRALSHPFNGERDPMLHYAASTALMRFIVGKCDIHQLLQLSVQHGLEGYLATFCGIKDLAGEFRVFVKKKAGGN